MQNFGSESNGQDKEFRKLQNALLQRILSSKIPHEREQLLSVHQRLLRQQRLRHASGKDDK